MSFWSSEDKIPVRQTKVSVKAETGLNYTDGQQITIIVPPTIQYFQPKESYLRFDVKLSQGGVFPNRLGLDAQLGGQVLIKDIRIHSGGAGAQLLEEYQDYNVLTALRYDYETDDTIRGKRALTEGASVYDQQTRGTRGTSQSQDANVVHNSAFKSYVEGSNPVATIATGGDGTPSPACWGDASSNPVGDGLFNGGNQSIKCLIPIHTGIFQNSKVFPALLTEGLRIEILLERAQSVMRMLDSTNTSRRKMLGPIFHSCSLTTGTNVGGMEDEMATNGRWFSGTADAGVADVFYVKRDNNMIGIENFPFVVGQAITFYDTRSDPVSLTTGGGTSAGGGATAVFLNARDDERMIIKDIQLVAGAGAVDTAGGWWGLIKVTIADETTVSPTYRGTVSTDGVTGVGGHWIMVDAGTRDNTAMAPTYSVSNVELILQQLEMPQGYTNKLMSMMKAGGQLNYDFLSSTNYKYSQVKTDIVANIRLPLSQSRAKSILSVPTDASVYAPEMAISCSKPSDTIRAVATGIWEAFNSDNWTYLERPNLMELGTGTWVDAQPDGCMFSNRSGLVGVWDNLTNYQWFYNGQLNPSRAIECDMVSQKESISQQPLIELEKALAMAGIRPLSFKAFSTNACIGRALALQDGVYDCRGRDFNLQIQYEGTAPTKSHLWHNFVHHVRRLVVKGDSISIQI